MSTAPIIIGTSQLPKPPIRMGMTIKKIIIKACAVTNTLYSCVLWSSSWLPGYANSTRINTDKKVPITPAKPPNKKYKVPISLWFVEQNHLRKKETHRRIHLRKKETHRRIHLGKKETHRLFPLRKKETTLLFIAYSLNF